MIEEFTPTPEQITFAEAYIKHSGNITAACAEIGDPYRNLYYGKPGGWHYQEGFEEWLSEYAKQSVLKRIGKWYLIAEKYAEAGSFQHLNMLMQIAKEFCPKETIISNTILNKSSVSGNVEFSQEDKELQAQIRAELLGEVSELKESDEEGRIRHDDANNSLRDTNSPC